MGRKRKLKMVVKVVPAGALRPNPRNAHTRETSEERHEGMLRCIVRGLAAADRKPVTPVHQDTSAPVEAGR